MKRFFHRYFCFWHLVYDSGAWHYCQCHVCGARKLIPDLEKRARSRGANVPDGDYYPPKPEPPKSPPRAISFSSSTNCHLECALEAAQIRAEIAASK